MSALLSVPTGYYYSSRQYDRVAASVANDPFSAAAQIGYLVDGDPPYALRTSAASRRSAPANAAAGMAAAAAAPPNLAEALNRADGAGPYSLFRHGPMPNEEEGKEELSCAALHSVKAWRFWGQVEGRSFDFVAAAGTESRYLDGDLQSASVPPTRRSVLATAVLATMADDEGSSQVDVRIGRVTGASVIADDLFAQPGLERMHQQPQRFRYQPLLTVRLTGASDRRIVSTSSPDLAPEEAGALFTEVTFLGRPLRMAVPDFVESAPTTFALAVVAHEWWPPSAW